MEVSKNNLGKNAVNSQRDYRFVALNDVIVYGDEYLTSKVKTIPKNTLYSFYREVIRDGIALLMIKENDDKFFYVEDDKKNISICKQCKVLSKPLDYIIIQHQEFGKYVVSNKPEVRMVKKEYVNNVNSCVTIKDNTTYVQIKDTYQKNDTEITTLNFVAFKIPLSQMKIGTLLSYSKFYIVQGGNEQKFKKIRTEDGQEGIVISSENTYTTIQTALDEFISYVIISLTILIIITTVYLIWDASGWIIFAGIAIVIVGYIVAIFVGAPLYLLLSQIIKRL